METTDRQVESVRCIACHAVYEHASAVPPDDASTVCPECGEATWLAARVPVLQTETAASA